MSTFKAAGHTYCCLHVNHSSSDNNADVLNNLHWSNITLIKKNAKEHRTGVGTCREFCCVRSYMIIKKGTIHGFMVWVYSMNRSLESDAER